MGVSLVLGVWDGEIIFSGEIVGVKVNVWVGVGVGVLVDVPVGVIVSVQVYVGEAVLGGNNIEIGRTKSLIRGSPIKQLCLV